MGKQPIGQRGPRRRGPVTQGRGRRAAAHHGQPLGGQGPPGGGLVDRLRLMVFPQILGNTEREPIFEGLRDIDLELAGTDVLDGRLVMIEYRPATADKHRRRAAADSAGPFWLPREPRMQHPA